MVWQTFQQIILDCLVPGFLPWRCLCMTFTWKHTQQTCSVNSARSLNQRTSDLVFLKIYSKRLSPLFQIGILLARKYRLALTYEMSYDVRLIFHVEMVRFKSGISVQNYEFLQASRVNKPKNRLAARGVGRKCLQLSVNLRRGKKRLPDRSTILRRETCICFPNLKGKNRI